LYLFVIFNLFRIIFLAFSFAYTGAFAKTFTSFAFVVFILMAKSIK
jgi:hypothetical protein